MLTVLAVLLLGGWSLWILIQRFRRANAVIDQAFAALELEAEYQRAREAGDIAKADQLEAALRDQRTTRRS